MFIHHAPAPWLAYHDDMLALMSPHMRPIFTAARDGGISLLAIDHHSGPVARPVSALPLITIIEDDPTPGISLGVGAFHRRSIRKLVLRSKLVIVNASAPDPLLYNLALVSATGLHWNVMVIETREAHAQEWMSAIEAVNPDVRLVVSDGFGDQSLSPICRQTDLSL